MFVNPEINYMVVSQWGSKNYSQLTSFVPYFGYKITKNFSVTFGPSITWAYSSDGNSPVKPLFSIHKQDIDMDELGKYSFSIGVRAGLRVSF